LVSFYPSEGKRVGRASTLGRSIFETGAGFEEEEESPFSLGLMMEK